MSAAVAAWAQDDSLPALLRQHQYANALSRADEQLRAHPKDSDLWMYRGLAQRGLDQKAPSLENIRHALTLDPSNTRAAEAGAQIAYRDHNPAEDWFLEQVFRLEPANPTAHAMAGVVALEKHDCPGAIRHFKRSVALANHDFSIKRQLAVCTADAGDQAGALQMLGELHAQQPEDHAVTLQLAAVHIEAHHFTEAIALLVPLKSLLDASGLGTLADAFAGADDVPNAVETYRAAIQLSPNEDRYYLDLAILSMDHQSPEVALGVLDSGIRNSPASSRLLVLRGTVYAQIGKNDRAQEDFERADRLDPKNIYGTLGLGVLLREESNLDQAQTVLEHKLSQTPNDPILDFMLADTLVRKGADPGDPTFVHAVSLLNDALNRDPNLAPAHALLGKLMLKDGRTNDAVVQLETAVHLQSSDRTALNQLLTAYRRLGRTADADRIGAILAEAVSTDRAQETAHNRTHLTLEAAPDAHAGASPNP